MSFIHLAQPADRSNQYILCLNTWHQNTLPSCIASPECLFHLLPFSVFNFFFFFVVFNWNRTIPSHHGLGICIVLLTIMHPWITKMSVTRWNSTTVPPATIPSGRSSKTHPCHSQYAMASVIASVVGIGVPSKYLDLPVLSLGSTDAVTLNRASRATPQRTKKARRRWSTQLRTPKANATDAGATPNETWQRYVSPWAWDKHQLEDSHQVGQWVQLLSHQGWLSSPSRNSSIHKIKEESQRHEP